MSHSRIFQIEDEPITTPYPYEILLDIADYTRKLREDERQDSIDWLKSWAKERGMMRVGKDKHGDYIVLTRKNDYFRDAYEQFVEAAKKLSEVSLEDFVVGNKTITDADGNRSFVGVSSQVYQLENAYHDGNYNSADNGFRFVSEDCPEADPFTFFARFVMDEGRKYYIGTIWDYHC